jgi:hypothetical protein
MQMAHGIAWLIAYNFKNMHAFSYLGQIKTHGNSSNRSAMGKKSKLRVISMGKG